jgi:hypothetical protein
MPTEVMKVEMIAFAMRLAGVVLLCLCASLSKGQDETARQKAKAIEQMRQVAKAIKQCPAKVDTNSPSPANNLCFSITAETGPPVNVTWDAHASKTARAPFEGWIEFDLPGGWSDDQRHSADPKVAKTCDRNFRMEAERADMLAQILLRVALGVGDDVELPRSNMWHYRFEFDVGSDEPELVKTLWIDRTGKAQPATDSSSCWVKAAQSVGAARADAPTAPQASKR